MCQFCSLSACKDCCKKERPFPYSSFDKDTQKHASRGKICKLCDNKFFVKKLVSGLIMQVEANQTSIESFGNNLAAHR